MPQKQDPYSVLKHLGAGAIAGAVSRSVTSPLERTKILLQLQAGDKKEAKYRSVSHTLRTIIKEEGLKGGGSVWKRDVTLREVVTERTKRARETKKTMNGLEFRKWFKGNGTNVVRILPYSAIQFAAYERYKMKIFHLEPGQQLNIFQRFVCGALAGITSVTFTYPLDLVRTRLSVGADGVASGGIYQTFRLVLSTLGPRGLYQGIGPTLMGIAPYVGLNFACYETLKLVGMRIAPEVVNNQGELPVSVRLFFGGTAGAVAQTFSFPLDVLRRRMQMQGAGEFPVYGTTWNCIKTTLKREGIRGFYKGAWPNLLKVAPATATTFVTYEYVKKLLAPIGL